MKTNRKGFTLVEIMIVVAIIGILTVIAIPNFIRARRSSQEKSCIANLKQIDGAIEAYKLAGKGDPENIADLTTTTEGADGESFLKAEPKCPIENKAYKIEGGEAKCDNNDGVTHNVHAPLGKL